MQSRSSSFAAAAARALVWVPIAFILLPSSFCLAAVDASAVRWKPQADMDNQLFPSLIIATATRRPGADADATPNPDLLGDHYGLLGISIRSPGPKTQIKLTIRENPVINTSTWTGTLAQGNHVYFIAPRISYKYDALRRVRGQTPLSVQFDLEVNGQPAGTKAETVALRSVNDCPWAVDSGEATISEDDTKDKPAADSPGKAPEGLPGESSTALGWMFAAYVNEDHPIIDVLLKEALHTGIITNVDGYQDEKPEEVLRQAYAVWKVLQDRGVRYSDVSTNPGGSDKVTSQYVRFVEESLRHEQANCVDGSVLFASILRKMGLAPFLLLVPHHMYVGVALSGAEDNEAVACIETTLLGAGQVDAALKPIKEMQVLEKTLDAAARSNPAWKSFKTAVSYATAAFHADKSKFDDDDETDYQIIDVAAARADGIMPIPFDRPERTPQLPGGPAHDVPPATPGTADKPLPTPFVKPPSSPAAPSAAVPKATPAPNSAAVPKPTPTPRPAATATPAPRATPAPKATPDEDAPDATTTTPRGHAPGSAHAPRPHAAASPTPEESPAEETGLSGAFERARAHSAPRPGGTRSPKPTPTPDDE